MSTTTDTFRTLHETGTFVMPNPYDIGSTKLLTALGFSALATTSAGFAATLGRADMHVSRDELVAHVAALTAATALPFNVDAERGYSDDPAGVAVTVSALAEAGAAGCSIEDWNPASDSIDPIDVATARIAAAAAAAQSSGLVLTARCENHIHGVDDLDDTTARLIAYRDAGAEVVYAPGLLDGSQLRHIVDELGVPVNALLLPGGLSVSEMAAAGVRRVSIGSGLSNIAYGAMVDAARTLLADGTIAATPRIDRRLAEAAFGGGA